MSAQTNLHLLGHSTSLIGRESEIAEICAQLADPYCRLLTLIGPGGIGKTRLALAIAARIDGFADGIHFVPLQPVASADLLVPAIATATGLPLAGQEPLLTQLLRNLRRKEMLLLLDNFEHLLPATDLLVEILREAPNVKLLVTSRGILGLYEEWLYPIQGLAVPPIAAADPAFLAGGNEVAMAESLDAAEYSAVQLFCLRARRVRRDFHWESEREAVIAICRHVEGNPLAVELAASWLSILNSATIAAQLDVEGRGMGVLASSLRDLPERHRSMRAVFDYSWQLLSETERAVFARMTVFHGGFTLAAAQAVAGATFDDLSGLVAKSLIRRDAEGRYRIHELLRQYAAEKLAAPPSAVHDAHRAHAAYFLAFLHERLRMYRTGQSLRAVQEIAADYENARAAWKWSIAHLQTQELQTQELQTQEQSEDIIWAGHALSTFYQCQSRYLEGAELFASAIHLLEGKAEDEAHAPLLAECLIFFAWLEIRLGRPAEAEQALTRARRLHDRFPSQSPENFVQLQLASMILKLVQGDYEGAAAVAHTVRLQTQQQNNLWHSSLTFYGSASASLAQGHYEQARAYAEQGLALSEALGDPWRGILMHDILGQVALIQGDLPAAKRHFEAAYAVTAAFKAPGGMALHLKNLGDVALLRQQWIEAGAYYAQSLERYHLTGDRGGAVTVERALGVVTYHLGDLNGARRHFRQALETALATDTIRLVLSVLAAAGVFLAEQLATRRGPAFSTPRAKQTDLLALRILRFVAQHPSADQTTRSEATAYLRGKNAALKGAADDSLELLTAALQAELTVAPERFLSPAPAHRLTPREPLTARESEVLKLLGAGCTNAEIADRLVITVGTVKFYTSNIYHKLDVLNRTQAIVRARELGILD